MPKHFLPAAAIFCSYCVVASSAEPLPEVPLTFLEKYCLDCHDSDTEKGEINLDTFDIDWSDHDNLFLWERVLNALKSGEMPPPDKTQPASEERESMQAWLHQSLLDHTEIGGTLARRFNRAEYLATVQSLFGLSSSFALPPGFPRDSEHHGFDNVGEGLVLSPPLLEAYAETARLIADEIFPPVRKAPESTISSASSDDLVISYSSGKVFDGALRLGMKTDTIARSATWPEKLEVDASGIYVITVKLSSFRPGKNASPMIVRVLAKDVSGDDFVSHGALRLLQEIEVTNESPENFTFKAELYEGQTPLIIWANAKLDCDRGDKEELKAFFEIRGETNPNYLAAWAAMLKSAKGQGFRGGVGWDRVKEQLSREDLPELDGKAREVLLKKIGGNPVLYGETVIFDVFENGPALEVHSLKVEGPNQLIDGPKEKQQQRLKEKFLGKEGDPKVAIRDFLSRAFRRPVDDEIVAIYLQVHDSHIANGQTPDEAMHLVIRDALISPRFLYRSLTDGPLDNYDLATRLAYFLTGLPPSSDLLKKAASGTLTDPKSLRKEAERLLPKSPGTPLITNFTGQWLDTRHLPDITPDPRFKFTSKDENVAKQEVEFFFYEMLKKNLPMTDFIDPDFTFTTGNFAKNFYGLKKGFDPKKANGLHRVSLQRGDRYGGVLGNSAVMMATANGVDTQPVLRGVWVLENILGMPPPPPPKAVPALTPDTQGATTPRDLLAAHTTEKSCAGCHRKIDPVGFVLENFDPVGRWRENWPDINKPVDATGTLPDGTEINDIIDFKKWMVENVDLFSECLSEKLLTYATGRVPNYSERQEIAAIVEANQKTGNGFRDLLLALIESETFRRK